VTFALFRGFRDPNIPQRDRRWKACLAAIGALAALVAHGTVAVEKVEERVEE